MLDLRLAISTDSFLFILVVPSSKLVTLELSGELVKN